MRARRFYHSKRFWIIVLAFVTISTFGSFVLIRGKEQVAERFLQHFTNQLSEQYGLQIRFREVAGNFYGTFILRDVDVETMNTEQPFKVFSAKEIQFRYSLMDFVNENFSGWFDIVLKEPHFVSNIPFASNVPEARSFEFFTITTQRIRENARLLIEDGTVSWLGREGVISGIEGVIANKSFQLQISLDHIHVEPFDITSTLIIEGTVDTDHETYPAMLKGSWKTQGTVINWKPIPQESEFYFEINPERLKITKSTILGGIQIEGYIGHTTRSDVELLVTASKYPLKSMHDILSFSGSQPLGGSLDGSLEISGSLHQPRLKGQFLVQNENDENAQFKNMQINFEGIYPEVHISESRLVTPSGSVMNFSNQTLHVAELLSESTYERLITAREQSTVAWGDWTLIRHEDEDVVTLEHDVGDMMKLSYERSEMDETTIYGEESQDEFQLEYLLGDEESIRMELRDDESFFVLQKKKTF